ncbi:MAG: arginine N-succinyltransferase [Deltaproteobacteria bacterium]|nr:arginine N-succinyltransferase [Deltaproteobacteria bacterium]
MFLLREPLPEDIDQIHEVARHLDTVNLPNDRRILERILDLSRRSHAGEIDPFDREYLLVLEDTEARRIIGTSMIHAQHGTRRAPHIFFEVLEEERYSETLDRYFVHQCLRIGYNYNGPTEIGGLILLPEYRGHPESLGKLLSYVRFLYIRLHRDKFRDEVLSELLPPLEPDGTSLLWESLGRHFTGLSYQEADRLSKDNKEFIRTLFPQGVIYSCLLPKHVQAVVGQVGPSTRGVEKMLKKIGFAYAHRIDPFDGGPHFLAKTENITLVQNTRTVRVSAVDGTDDGRPQGIVAVERGQAPHFLAIGTRYRPGPGSGDIGLTDAARSALKVQPGDQVALLPL